MPEPPPRTEDKAPTAGPEATSERASATFREIYDAHFALAWRFAAYRGVPRAALDAVVQEVFVIVYQELGGFEGRSGVKTGVARVTRHVVRAYLRKRRGSPTPQPGAPHEPSSSTQLDGDGALDEGGAGALLDASLNEMSVLQREAFVLCEMEGLTAAETAEALGADENTLRARLDDARKVFNAASARLRAERFWMTRREQDS